MEIKGGDGFLTGLAFLPVASSSASSVAGPKDIDLLVLPSALKSRHQSIDFHQPMDDPVSHAKPILSLCQAESAFQIFRNLLGCFHRKGKPLSLVFVIARDTQREPDALDRSGGSFAEFCGLLQGQIRPIRRNPRYSPR